MVDPWPTVASDPGTWSENISSSTLLEMETLTPLTWENCSFGGCFFVLF